jgi:hypothetical protein
MLEQTLLDGQTAGITMQAAVLSQDTVTGNDNGDGITPIGAAHLVCQFLVLHNGAFAIPVCRSKHAARRSQRATKRRYFFWNQANVRSAWKREPLF